MIVTLTHYQARSVAHRVSKLHHRVMLQHRTKRGRTQHDYDLPAIAWRQILDEMQRVCFGPMGGKLDRGVPKSAYTAIRRIADGVRRIENHPALRGRTIEGWVGDVLLLWSNGSLLPYLEWSPYPDPSEPEASLRLFKPCHATVNGMEVTCWRPEDPVDVGVWSLHSDAHWAFVGVDARSDSELLPDEFEFEDLVGRQSFGSTD